MESPRLLTVLTSLLIATAALVVLPLTAGAAQAVVEPCTVSNTTCDLDTDADGLGDDVDGCPTVASTNPTGCPSAKRSARLRYLKGKNQLQATITSPVAACSSGAKVKLWRVGRQRGTPLEVATTSASGRYHFKVPMGARYYVMVTPSYSAGIAECGEATSRKVLVPRRHRS